MTQPNLEVIPSDNAGNTNPGVDTKQPFGSWPTDPAQSAQRGARNAMIVAVLALLIGAGGTAFQYLSLQKLNDSLSRAKADLNKALEAERKKNDIGTKLSEAMTAEEKVNAEAMEKMRAELVKMHQDDMNAMRAEIETLKSRPTRAPASTPGKAKAKAKKHKKH